MKKYLGILIGLLILSQSLFAVDTVRVIRDGKLIKTSAVDLTSISVVTLTTNYNVTGNVSCNTLVVTTSATIVTASITYLGKNLAAQGYNISGIGTLSSITTANFNSGCKFIVPTATATVTLNPTKRWQVQDSAGVTYDILLLK